MQVEDLPIKGLKLVTPKKIEDPRGFFSEIFNRRTWLKAGLPDLNFVQDNQSLSREAGTIRGLHFQTHPFAQDKLVRVVRGAIIDVAVDLRRASSTFGRSVAVELSAANWRQLLIPIGFAHGFCTLEPDTEICYKVTNYYSAANDRGLAFDDPDLNIAWPCPLEKAFLSDKDKTWPRLRDFQETFE